MAEMNRKPGEDFTSYWIRLADNKEEYALTWDEIATLLNAEAGENYTECKWRKDYAMFNKGRLYERSHAAQSVANRILCLSDFHVPYQLPVDTFAKYAGKVDTLVLNGDIGDCQAISKFPKTYRISPMEELIQTREYLIELIEYIAPKKVVVTYGNHDLRFQSYLAKNLDSDLLELMPQTSLELLFVDGFNHYDKKTFVKSHYPPLCDVLGDVEIDYVNNWWTQIGDAIICHPIAFSSAMMQTAKKAMEYFRNTGVGVGWEKPRIILGHTHHIGFYRIGSMSIYEQGCCCQTDKLAYGDGQLYNPQEKGFMYFGQDVHGNTIEDTIALVPID